MEILRVVECKNCGNKVVFRDFLYRKDLVVAEVTLDGAYGDVEENLVVERCPFCNYCGLKIGETLFESKETVLNLDLTLILERLSGEEVKENREKTEKEIISEVVSSDEYREQLKSELFPEKANCLLCSSLIDEKLGNYASAGLSALKAAWICESSERKLRDFAAKKCRERAFRLLEKAKQLKDEGDLSQSFAENEEKEVLLLIDIARRIGKFDKAMDLLSELQSSGDLKENVRKVLEFQKHLVRMCDSGVYFGSDVETFDKKVKDGKARDLLRKAISVFDELERKGRLKGYEEEFMVLNELSYFLRNKEIPLTDGNFELLSKLVAKIIKLCKREEESRWVRETKESCLEVLESKGHAIPADLVNYFLKNVKCFFWTIDKNEDCYYTIVEPTASVSGFLTTVAVGVPSVLGEFIQPERLINGSSFFLSLFYIPVMGDISSSLGNTPEKFREMMAVYSLGYAPYYVVKYFRQKKELRLMAYAFVEMYFLLEEAFLMLDFIHRGVFYEEIFGLLGSERERFLFEELWRRAINRREEIKREDRCLISCWGAPGFLEEVPSKKSFWFGRQFDLDDFRNLFRQFKMANFFPEIFYEAFNGCGGASWKD